MDQYARPETMLIAAAAIAACAPALAVPPGRATIPRARRQPGRGGVADGGRTIAGPETAQ